MATPGGRRRAGTSGASSVMNSSVASTSSRTSAAAAASRLDRLRYLGPVSYNHSRVDNRRGSGAVATRQATSTSSSSSHAPANLRNSVNLHNSVNLSASINTGGRALPHQANASSPALIKRTTPVVAPPKKDRNESGVAGRVRVAVRLRPANAEEMVADSDFAEILELQPELKRLKLRKNNWECETYQFDEILNEFASQKRVYEVVAKPVVESVLEGYNGTIMAYGQTGTGKTFTLGKLGEEDTSERGIMVRAMEEILADIFPEHDSVSVSYIQLYMETVQDLLAPENYNIPIVEDPRTGDVSLPGATVIEIWDQKNFEELLRVGEANRIATITRLNTDSSRSHAILMVHVKKIMKPIEKDLAALKQNGNVLHSAKEIHASRIRKSKLIVVDLAGSERINKSGSEGHALEEAKSINLSLTSLGKCINALAENSPHVPTRDSKLTRILRDSFGGSARTSLVITIGPSPRHRAETASTIMFGQRAMKVQNMVKLKEEFDYKSLCRRLEMELDKLIAQNESQSKKLLDSEKEMNGQLETARADAIEAKTNLKHTLDAMEAEKFRHEEELIEITAKLEREQAETERLEEELKQNSSKKDADCSIALMDEIMDLKLQLETERQLREKAEMELRHVKPSDDYNLFTRIQNPEVLFLNDRLEDEIRQREKLDEEIKSLRTQLLKLSHVANESRKTMDKSSSGRLSFSSDTTVNVHKSNPRSSTIAKLFEQVGLQKILSLLASEDPDVRIHAVKVIANLAAEEVNQEKIVEAGGLSSLLILLQNSKDETIQRVAAGAIANLAMNETNQHLIMSQGGISLLARIANEAKDPQTLRMVAGAIANLCGNEKLQANLREAGALRALLGMVRCKHLDVLAQVARGMANFSKCESRITSQGLRRGKSLLIEDEALPWLVENASNEDSHIRRHVELALCHLAQNESNAKDIIATRGLNELVHIAKECSREDIRNLAHYILTKNLAFQSELRISKRERR